MLGTGSRFVNKSLHYIDVDAKNICFEAPTRLAAFGR